MDTWTATQYFIDILRSIGAHELEAEGMADPSEDASLAKGIELAQDWEADNDIAIDPRFPDITLADDSFDAHP